MDDDFLNASPQEMMGWRAVVARSNRNPQKIAIIELLAS